MLEAELQNQLEQLQSELLSISEEISQETKSSAGDKYETSREMMQQSRDRVSSRIHHLQLQNSTLLAMKNAEKSTEIGFGSLVESDKGHFLFGVALGKIQFMENSIMVLSLNSPLGKVFVHHKVGDELQFRTTNYLIKSIE